MPRTSCNFVDAYHLTCDSPSPPRPLALTRTPLAFSVAIRHVWALSAAPAASWGGALGLDGENTPGGHGAASGGGDTSGGGGVASGGGRVLGDVVFNCSPAQHGGSTSIGEGDIGCSPASRREDFGAAATRASVAPRRPRLREAWRVPGAGGLVRGAALVEGGVTVGEGGAGSD